MSSSLSDFLEEHIALCLRALTDHFRRRASVLGAARVQQGVVEYVILVTSIRQITKERTRLDPVGTAALVQL